jgi:hypothetical protein
MSTTTILAIRLMMGAGLMAFAFLMQFIVDLFQNKSSHDAAKVLPSVSKTSPSLIAH